MEIANFFNFPTLCYEVRDLSQVGHVRRAAAEQCKNLQFSETIAGAVSIIVNELGTNLVKHAQDGLLLLNSVWSPTGPWLDVISIDAGPGIADVTKCMEDGFSSSGTAGNGLGAVKRMASTFDFVTRPGSGSVFLARVHAGTTPKLPGGLHPGVINLPKSGEPVSGDSWAVKYKEGEWSLLVVDGLGHGISAADASREAVRIFRDEMTFSPVPALQAMHGALRPTRGAAAAVAHLDLGMHKVTYAGIGNIAGVLLSEEMQSRSMVSQNGIVGHEAKRFSEFSYPWNPGTMLVMYSDGLQSQLSLQKYPGITRRDPAVIAAVLWCDFTRKRDDATVLVLK